MLVTPHHLISKNNGCLTWKVLEIQAKLRWKRTKSDGCGVFCKERDMGTCQGIGDEGKKKRKKVYDEGKKEKESMHSAWRMNREKAWERARA